MGNQEDFCGFAADQLLLWSDLIGAKVTHEERGDGIIANVEQRKNYIPLVLLKFGNETVTFNADSFKNGKTLLAVPSAVASDVAAWSALQSELERARLAREAREKDFEPLAAKYHVPSIELWDGESISPLASVLAKLEADDLPNNLEIEWLEDRELHRLIATIHYRHYRRTGDPWSLAKACKFLRKAHLPGKVIAVSGDIFSTNMQDKKALSALWTTRGGAFRDLNDLRAAKQSAKNAIQESPTSFHPHNLMGAILYEEGSPSEGDEHFVEALKLGSTPRDQDLEIRKSLDRSAPEARRKVIEYLLSKDPSKYAWVTAPPRLRHS